MEWTTAASFSVRLAKTGYDHRRTIQKYWTRAKAALDVGGTQIVVTGHSAAGKSLLTAQIHGSARELFFEEPDESLTVEVEAVVLGEWAKLVRVLPGQKTRRTSGEIEAFRENASLEGVIHVVDYGFVAPRDEVSVTTMIEVDKVDTLDKLRSINLDEEVNELRDVLNSIRLSRHSNGCPKWMVIAVNKVDLFSDQRVSALQHYHPKGSSAFSQELRTYQNAVGSNNFPIYVCQACAFESDFVWNGEVVRSNLARQEQKAILREFASTLAAISTADQ